MVSNVQASRVTGVVTIDLSLVDELLAAVNIDRCPGDRGVGHQVDCELGDVLRADHPSDGKRPAEFLAAHVQSLAEELGGERRIHEPGGDDVRPNRSELDSKASCQRRKLGRDRREHRRSAGRPPAARAAHEEQGSACSHPGGGVFARPWSGNSRCASTSRRVASMSFHGAYDGPGPVTRTWSSGRGQLGKEPCELAEVGGIEGYGASRMDLDRRLL